MHHLLKVFLDILRLRKGPQDLPASQFLLGVVLALHFLLGVTLLAATLSFASALFAALVGTGLTVVLVQAALFLRRLSNRFVQTATAMAGCEFLLALVTVPFAGAHPSGFASIVSLLVMGWSFAVAAHIFRHALDLSSWRGFAVALGYMLISYTVAGILIGPGT